MLLEALLLAVIAVHDGDTLTIIDENKTQTKVRLAEIDAPELDQHYGKRAKRSLAAICFHAKIEIDKRGIDRYGRTLARVTCNGVDANAAQVARGMAWVYRESGPAELLRKEAAARSQKRGLWLGRCHVPPWVWRKKPSHLPCS